MLVVNLTPSSTAEGGPGSGGGGTGVSFHRRHGGGPRGGGGRRGGPGGDERVRHRRDNRTELVLSSAYGDRDRGPGWKCRCRGEGRGRVGRVERHGPWHVAGRVREGERERARHDGLGERHGRVDARRVARRAGERNLRGNLGRRGRRLGGIENDVQAVAGSLVSRGGKAG